tara:strand:- start:26 stop:493 length:468 start_codon:yes stop_codon:yes gene_type:complete
MASEIKVDTIVNAGGDNDTGIDLATNDQILLKVANATKLTMNSTGQTTIVGEGGTTTTNLQQGLCKSWIQFNGSSFSTQDSFNRGSLTDNGTGDYTLGFTNNMNNDDYHVALGFNSKQSLINALATSTVRVIAENDGGTAQDASIVTLGVHGDLA